MIVAGAGGFAKQLMSCITNKEYKDLLFFNELAKKENYFLEQFKITNDLKVVQKHLQNIDNRFVLGTGNPKVRSYFMDKLVQQGGIPTTLISPQAYISPFVKNIANGITILGNTIVEPDVIIKKGTLINLSTTITHDCIIGKFVEICPGVHLSGGCEIGDYAFIGTGAVVLPHVKIGQSAIVGAGAVVTTDVPDYHKVVGVPATTK
ncbi:MAG: NeuD/PglB/VioB family sugar acetyltransferase [Flavobacteriaceae bacterium]